VLLPGHTPTAGRYGPRLAWRTVLG